MQGTNTLPIFKKGRDVTFSKTCGQIAYCEFEELCGRPLFKALQDPKNKE